MRNSTLCIFNEGKPNLTIPYRILGIINPRRACAARVTVGVGLSVRLSVCLFGDISLLEPSIAPQTILRIQRSENM